MYREMPINQMFEIHHEIKLKKASYSVWWSTDYDRYTYSDSSNVLLGIKNKHIINMNSNSLIIINWNVQRSIDKLAHINIV